MNKPKNDNRAVDLAREIFTKAGGVLRTREALAAGIHPRTLYSMRDSHLIELLERGLYRLTGLPPLTDPDLVTVAMKSPNAVLCLVSALSFHNITSEIPHVVHLAIKRGAEPPRIAHPPTKVYWFSGEAFSSGIEDHLVNKKTARVYSVEKTLADCFKYRNKIGMDTVLEALAFYRDRKKTQPRELLKFAKICRVENVMQPYLEATL